MACTAEVDLPVSASKLDVMILTSWIVSGAGLMRMYPRVGPVLSVPSKVKFTPPTGWPLTVYVLPPAGFNA